MKQPKFKIEYKGDFLNGEFQKPADPNGEWTVNSPACLSDSLGVLSFSYAHVDQAVASAKEAQRLWRKEKESDRVAILKKYKEELTRRKDEIAECLAREVGKPLWEAETEVKAMIGKVDITANESLALVEEKTYPSITPTANGRCAYRPLGVLAVIGPFNFPGHLPNGHIVPALMTGNSVIFKPSEKTPFVAQIMAECFEQAGVPKGVFQVIQGEKGNQSSLMYSRGC